MLSLIVAYDADRGIGKENRLPWHLPEDFKWFKNNTMGKKVVMGSKTYFSIPSKYRPLSGRENWVLTTNEESAEIIRNEGAEVVSFSDIINSSDDIMVIGGANIYNQLIDYCEKLYITKINAYFDCDTRFPYFNEYHFEHTFESKQMFDDDGIYTYTFNIYTRK